MKQLCKYILLCYLTAFVSFCSVTELKGQDTPVNDTVRTSFFQMGDDVIKREDTIRAHQLPDSYKTLKVQSSKNRWTKRLFSLLVREPKTPDKTKENKSITDDYKSYEGKIIRTINIDVIPPFGTDIQNPEYRDEDAEMFNKAHIPTQDATIKRMVQFKAGDRVNPALMAASEAYLRALNYIYDARVIVQPIPLENDMVDVLIVVRDKWTIGVDIHRFSSSRINIELFDKNVIGSGSRIGLNAIYSQKYGNKFGFGGNYLYQNIANTQIDFEGNYVDQVRDHELYLSVARRLQPKLNYFGEVSYWNNIWRPDRYKWDSITPDRKEQFSVTIGRAFTLSDDYALRRLVIGLRYKQKSPEFRPVAFQEYMKDKLLPYRHVKNRIWLMQLSLYQNSYHREYLVYNFGTTEDVALGYNISMQLGYSRFDNIAIKDGMYSSLSASYGTNKLTRGNLYLNSAISSFWGKKKPFQSVLKFNIHYFTPLLQMANIRLRQFLTLDYGKLLTPDRYFGDRIFMGEHTTLKMKDWRKGRQGVEQLLFKSETDMFSNYEIAGFRCLFYSFFDMGWITNNGKLFSGENINYGIGFGIRLRNDFIILNTIDLKIGFYPKLDQSGFRSFFKVRSSTPNIPPDFVPGLPQEILLEYD